MSFLRLLKRYARRKSALGVIATVAAICSGPALAVPAYSQQITPRAANAAAPTAADALRNVKGASDLATVPTLQSRDGSGMAKLPVIPGKMSCSQLAHTTNVNGQTIHIVKYQTASASSGSPKYCAVTGHINTYIGFEILLPTSTWRQRYLQVGCGGL